MAGTKIGAAKAAATNKEKFGADFYKRIGHAGGSVTGVKKGFAANPELAIKAGTLGGQRSRRGKAKIAEGLFKQQPVESLFVPSKPWYQRLFK